MKTKLRASILLVFQLHVFVVTAQFMQISRRSSGVDTFNLPPWMCSDTRFSCSSFNAVGQIRSCSCQCSIPRATFSFFNNRWVCTTNRQTRDHLQQGCDGKASLVSETADGRLPTLNFGDVRETSMRYLLWERWTCSLKFDSSSYMTCNGTKRAFTQQYLNVVPSLLTMTRASANERYFLRINTGVNGSNILRGKILNLYIECGGIVPIVLRRVTIGLCLSFKLQGTESCLVNAPPSSSSSTILPTKITRVTDSPVISPKATSEVFVASAEVHTSTPKASINSQSVPSTSPMASKSTLGLQSSGGLSTGRVSTTTFTTTIPASLTKVSAITSSTFPKYTRQVSDHPLESSFDNTRKPSYATHTTFLASFTMKLSSSTRMPDVSSTVYNLQPTRSSSSAFLITPTASGSPMVANPAQRTSVTLPTTSKGTPRVEVSSKSSTVSVSSWITRAFSSPSILSGHVPRVLPATQILPTVKVPPVVIEFSSTAIKGQATPIVLPPTGPRTESVTLEPKIPPNVSGGRKGENNSLHIGISTGITAFVIVTVIIVGYLVYRRQRSKMPLRPRSESQETKISVISPTTNSPSDEDDTIRRSPLFVQDYGIPSWEDQEDKGPVYAVIEFPEKHSKDEKKEPFYCVVEEAALIDKQTGSSGASKNPKSEKHFNEDHIYAKVKNKKKRPIENSLKLPDFINLKENSHCGSSEDETGPVLEILGPYVRGAQEPDLPEFTPEKPVYFTLEECFSDTFRRTNDDLECGDGPIFRLVGGPDQYRAICTEALVYYTLNESEQDEENDNSSKFTIGQVFDELEERFLNKDGEPGSTNPERPEPIPEKSYTGRQLANASEPVYNFLEELFPKGTPTFSRRTIRNEDGPIYFHLRRLKSNHSKATRIQPKWRDVEDENPTGADGNKKTNPVYTRAPAFYTLERSDSDRQNDSNDMFTIEEAFDQLQDRYLKNPEEAKNASLERPGLVPQARSSNEKGTGDSEGTGEPGNKVLGEKEAVPFQLLSNHDGPVYLHLRRLKSNHSKATRIRPHLENEGKCGDKEGQDNTDKGHYENVPIYARAPVFYTLKRSGIEKQNNNNTLVTIEQAFDELKDRYFEKPEGARNSDPKNSSVQLQKDYLDSEQTKNSIAEPKPMLNLLEQVRGQGTSKFQSLSDHDGPVYLHLRRLKSNHSKATRIRPHLENEGECGSKEGQDNTDQGHYENIPIYARAPVFYTLKKPGTEKQNNNNTLVTIEQAFDELKDRYFEKPEGARNSDPKNSSVHLQKDYLDSEKTKNAIAEPEPMLNLLEQVRGQGTSKFQSLSDHDGPVYLHLKRLKSNHSKATRIRPRLEGESECSAVRDQTRKRADDDGGRDPIYARAPVFYTLERSGSDKQAKENNLFTIEQAFDQLEDRYLKNQEEAENSSLEGPSLTLKSRCLDRRGANYSAGTSEPVLNNIFDEVCGKEIQTFSPISNYRGPIYFNLRRLKSNHSKATRIQSEWEDEPVYSVIEEQYLKGSEGKDTSKEEPIYLTLEELCSDTLKRDTSDNQDDDELDDDIFVARYLESTEDADSSARPVFYSLDTFRTKKFERTSSNESQC